MCVGTYKEEQEYMWQKTFCIHRKTRDTEFCTCYNSMTYVYICHGIYMSYVTVMIHNSVRVIIYEIFCTHYCILHIAYYTHDCILHIAYYV